MLCEFYPVASISIIESCFFQKQEQIPCSFQEQDAIISFFIIPSLINNENWQATSFISDKTFYHFFSFLT